MIIFGVFQQRKETFAQYSHNNDTWRHLKGQKLSKKRARNKINGLKINFICVYFEIITESVSDNDKKYNNNKYYKNVARENANYRDK